MVSGQSEERIKWITSGSPTIRPQSHHSQSSSATAFPASGQFRNRASLMRSSQAQGTQGLNKEHVRKDICTSFSRLPGVHHANALAGLALRIANAREGA